LDLDPFDLPAIAAAVEGDDNDGDASLAQLGHDRRFVLLVDQLLGCFSAGGHPSQAPPSDAASRSRSRCRRLAAW
jgi:hypothetical protein